MGFAWSLDLDRAGVRDVVFFMHGILDTSMGWVANGTGSHAFAAYDQGMDVWLGSSRSNWPRQHVGELLIPSTHLLQSDACRHPLQRTLAAFGRQVTLCAQCL